MIKNIIFDFGDVFLNLDKSAAAKALAAYGFIETTPELDLLFKDYEKGVISTEPFLNATKAVFPKATVPQLIAAWNSILLDFPLSRLEFLEQLASKNQYRLFLLSNTNELHIDFVRKQMGDPDYGRFKDCFEQFYLSYEMGMRKPDLEIFEYILHQNYLTAPETLFIDDTLENIETASTMGIKCWHLVVGKEEVTELKNHL